MDCPNCDHDPTHVVDTGTTTDGTAVRRRRECGACSFRFTTYERTEWDSLRVEKRDGSVEPFDREKLRTGIERAVEKRPVDAGDVATLVEEVEADLPEGDGRVVTSERVGALVSERLRSVDQVAYVRFVSVYRAFSDPAAFRRELDAVLDDDAHDDRDEGGQRREQTDSDT
ncbi:transcriptional regulator NrdR [Haloarchaeobius iranensis]|uniref:Transcriptional repressor NrdR n=1 Tax=Haloarchaeobius iranensis TaxID=996166 RepID=A0A1G9V3M3_9EURY|nr:transcriptional regulator NrdR [Haloarchaeobius iranensis]SDM66758.1 transcriptional repressor NrdR [Haloarchaeobius iranensis]